MTEDQPLSPEEEAAEVRRSIRRNLALLLGPELVQDLDELVDLARASGDTRVRAVLTRIDAHGLAPNDEERARWEERRAQQPPPPDRALVIPEEDAEGIGNDGAVYADSEGKLYQVEHQFRPGTEVELLRRMGGGNVLGTNPFQTSATARDLEDLGSRRAAWNQRYWPPRAGGAS